MLDEAWSVEAKGKVVLPFSFWRKLLVCLFGESPIPYMKGRKEEEEEEEKWW